jgi:hypothetical protein
LQVAVASADDELPVVDATSCDLANLPANWLSIVLPESDLTAEIAYLDSYPASGGRLIPSYLLPTPSSCCPSHVVPPPTDLLPETHGHLAAMAVSLSFNFVK